MRAPSYRARGQLCNRALQLTKRRVFEVGRTLVGVIYVRFAAERHC